jgi:hypothetical protein
MSRQHLNPALAQAVSAALNAFSRPSISPPTPRHKAPHRTPAPAKTNPPPPRPLSIRQRRAIQFLVAGHTLTATATALGLHRYTLTRWLQNPLFQAHLDRHLAVTSATLRHIAPQSAAPSTPPAQNEPTAPPPVPPFHASGAPPPPFPQRT